MTALSASVAIAEGVEMPAVGLGTFRLQGAEVRSAVRAALAVGIRHIDTATCYKNEADVATALAASGLPRGQLFLTTKVSPLEQGAAAAGVACERVRQRLEPAGGYADLCLVHWPGAAKRGAASPENARLRRETWAVLEGYCRQGSFRAIGVSNYETAHLEELLGYAEIRPAVNQVELHPHWQQAELRRYCQARGIMLAAYSPLGAGALPAHPAVAAAAALAGLSPTQALLRWALQSGAADAVLVKSAKEERIREWAPAELLGPQSELPGEAMALLDGLGAGPRKYCWDPATIA